MYMSSLCQELTVSAYAQEGGKDGGVDDATFIFQQLKLMIKVFFLISGWNLFLLE